MAGEYFMLGVDPTLESSLPRMDPNTGVYWEEIWSGSADSINQIINQFNLNQRDTDQSYVLDAGQKPLYKILIRTPDFNDGRNNALNKWELVHNKVELDLRQHPIYKGITEAEAQIIRDLLAFRTTLAALTAPLSKPAAVVFNDLKKGLNKTLGQERVFRYTITTSKRFGNFVAEFGLFKLWTTAQLMNPAASGLIIPAGVLFSLTAIQAPFSLSSIVEVCDMGGAPAGTNVVNQTYTYAWLKMPPDIEQLPVGKIRITQEWWLDYWSTYSSTDGVGQYQLQT